jgi:2-oxoglutarate ferredoxin oxidoreductase subunit beta
VVRDLATGAFGVRKVAEVGLDSVVVHDQAVQDPSYAFALSRLTGSDLEHTVTGVFRAVQRPTYDDQARAQVEQAKAAKSADLQGLLRGNDTWTVAG